MDEAALAGVIQRDSQGEAVELSELIRPDDSRLRWEGAISVQHTSAWSQPWRLPHEQIELFPPEMLQERAAMAAGVRLTFVSDTTFVAGTVVPQAEIAPIDLAVDGTVAGSRELGGREAFRFEDLPAGEKVIELWLPQALGPFRLRSLELSSEASLRPHQDSRPKWVTYGSSITQCAAAQSPAYTWPAVVARGANLHLTCLGFGGQCHLDPMIVRLIRDRDADFISMCLGINIQGAASLGPRAFKPAIIGAVHTVREKHPDTPIALISPIYSPPRESTPNAVGFHLEGMREEVADAVERLKAHGDRNVHYVNGLDLFGPDLAHLLPDELHPNAEGYKTMGRNFLEKVIPQVLPKIAVAG